MLPQLNNTAEGYSETRILTQQSSTALLDLLLGDTYYLIPKTTDNLTLHTVTYH